MRNTKFYFLIDEKKDRFIEKVNVVSLITEDSKKYYQIQQERKYTNMLGDEIILANDHIVDIEKHKTKIEKRFDKLVLRFKEKNQSVTNDIEKSREMIVTDNKIEVIN